jgi:hypothetical protein
MLKLALVSIFAVCFATAPAFAAKSAPSKASAKAASKAKPAEQIEADKIEASLAELNDLVNDKSLSPRKKGQQASLSDFQENLELSNGKATLTTDDFAKKDGGLQEMSPDVMVAPESELE